MLLQQCKAVSVNGSCVTCTSCFLLGTSFCLITQASVAKRDNFLLGTVEVAGLYSISLFLIHLSYLALYMVSAGRCDGMFAANSYY